MINTMLDLIIVILIITIFWKSIVEIAAKDSPIPVLSIDSEPITKYKAINNNSLVFRPVYGRNENKTNSEENFEKDNEITLLKGRLNTAEKDLEKTVNSLSKALREINRLNHENNQ